MFNFEYLDAELKDKLENPEKHYPDEVCQELCQFIEILRKDGQVRDPDYFRGNISGISGKTFYLQYISDFHRKFIKIIDIEIKTVELLRTQFSIQDTWDDSDVIEVIPQCDPPPKIIKALKLILNGIVDSYELGYELGHRGKERRYISRHGQYTRQALEVLKLVECRKEGRKLVPELTARGERIAKTDDEQLQHKLLTVAMLNYRPVWNIINATTESGKDEFDDSTIQRIAFPEEFRTANTCDRRTSTLKTWIKWISSTSGIPIRLPGGYIQLTLFSQNPSDIQE